MNNPNGNLFFAMMFSDREKFNNCLIELKNKFGDIEKQSHEYNFDKYTGYYEKEMGEGLRKVIIIFKKLIEEDDLIKIKKEINELEKKYSIENKRTVNIDPGFLSKEKVILASFKKKDFKKDFGQGIYTHTVLEFKEGKVKEFWHTFGDYRGEKTKKFLSKVS